eukprot:1812374-Rhodomonas_salina.1
MLLPGGQDFAYPRLPLEPQVQCAISLRARYAMSGPDQAYRATRLMLARPETLLLSTARYLSGAPVSPSQKIVDDCEIRVGVCSVALRIPYAMSGTEKGYAATRSGT